MSPTTKARALHFGLPGHPFDPSISNEAVQAQVKSGAEKARHAGYTVQLTFLDPADFSKSLSDLKSELKTGNWDALIVGGGIRMAPDLTDKFEEAVNISRENAPTTKILFQKAPGDIFETLERRFGAGQ